MIEQTTELQIIKSSRKRRIVAFLTDHIVLTFLGASVVFLILGPDFIDKINIDHFRNILILVLLPVFLIYFCKDFINGISLGRWIMGIMVRDEDNSKEVPSKTRLFVRNLFLLIWPVELLALIFNKNKQRFGDNFAKTIVVKNPDKAKKSSRVIALGVIFIVCVGFTTLFTGITLKSSEAYKTAIIEIENNADILKETGGIKGYGSFPKGNINITNDYGQAMLEIEVIGNSKDLDIRVFLEKEPNGLWKVTDMRK